MDEMMRDAVARGMTALTVWPTGEGKWQCNARFKRTNGEGWACVTDADPVAGAMKAMQDSAPSPKPANPYGF